MSSGGGTSFVRDYFAQKRKPPVSTYEKLGNREPHPIEAQVDGAPAQDDGGVSQATSKALLRKTIKFPPPEAPGDEKENADDERAINIAFKNGGLGKGQPLRESKEAKKFAITREDKKTRAKHPGGPIAGDCGVLLALDHGLIHNMGNGIRTRPAREGMAFDLRSVRAFTKDGYLNVETSHISKATVNPYLGREIPDWERLGLDPNRIYKLFRDPQELAKAAPTFNNLPLLNKHVPVSSESFPEDSIIGSTGTDCEFGSPYLDNSLVFWRKDAIKDIESEKKRELSCGYRYDPDMTPGNFQGQQYDGVMRNIIGNHVALVEEGRAGPDVMVGDSMENIRMAKKPKMSKQAVIVAHLLTSTLRPKLAVDSKLNLLPLLDGVTASNYAERKPQILKGLRSAMKLRTILAADRRPVSRKQAMDATIGEVAELLDMIEQHGVENDHEVAPAAVPEMEVGAEPAPAPPMEAGGEEGGEEEMGGGGEEPPPMEEHHEEEEHDMGSELEALLKGKVDGETLAKVLALVKGAGAGDNDPHLEELGAAGEDDIEGLHDGADDELLEEDPNAQKGTGTGKGSPGAGGEKSASDKKRADDKRMGRDRMHADDRKHADDRRMGKDRKRADDKRMGKDQPPAFKGMPKPGGSMAGDRRPAALTMDAANKLVRDAVQDERRNQHEIRTALAFVRPWVGDVNPDIAFDSASGVYRATLESLGMDAAELDDIDPSAYRALVMHMQKPEEQRRQQSNRRGMANDARTASASKGFAERYPDAARIRHM